jgi:hypothetical protein
MQVKQIVLACAAALAVAPAFAAFDPADVGTATKIILSGATAPDGFVKDSVIEMLKPGFKSYRNDDITEAFKYRAWFGAAKAGIPGVAENTPILLVKRSKGGSVWGVDPIARASRIQTLDFGACAVSGVAVVKDANAVYDYHCGVKGLDPDSPDFANAAINNGEISDFGVSDVNPKLFKGPYNVEFGQSQLTETEAAVLTVKPVNTVMMGLVATNAVPLTTRITRADYANMLAGKLYNWTQIDASLTGNNNVVVCRRVNGSGTQASYNWFFNNFPCQSAFAGSLAPADMLNDSEYGIDSGTGTLADPFVILPHDGADGYYTVVNNSTSGDVVNCLKNAQTHQDHTFLGDDGMYYTIKFSNSTDPFKAIGVLSTDSFGKEAGNWSYRHLDGAGSFDVATQASSVGATGIAPSKANLLDGAYDFSVELTMQYRNAAVTNPQGDVVPALSGVKQSFADELIKRSGDPAKIALNSKAKVYAALPDFYNRTGATNAAHVAKGSHQGNMCQPLVRKY